MASQTVKMCDMPISIAAQVFVQINHTKIKLAKHQYFGTVIVSDIEPKDLIYPEGWYYAKGNFRNKHQSTGGIYEEMPMLKSNGDRWKDEALYCTLRD